MKIVNFLFSVLILFLFVGCGAKLVPDKAEMNEFNSDLDKAGYMNGYQYGIQLNKQGLDSISLPLFYKGFAEGISGAKALFNDEDVQKISKFSADLIARKRAIIAKNNLEKGKVFLESNKNAGGVISLPNGLQYKILYSGNGQSPKPEDKVRVHYAGRTTDGTEFDSSIKSKEPPVFGVKRVIKGWTEILQHMKEGDKWEVYIPSELAYGERGSGAAIGPNEVLIFIIDLIAIEK